MELLKQLLSADNIVIQDLETEVSMLGYDPTALTDAQAMEAATKLKAKAGKAITKSNGRGKATKIQPKEPQQTLNRDTRTDRTPSVNNGLGQSLNHAVSQSVEEVQIIQSGVKAAKDKIVAAKANEMLDQIADIPNATLQEFSKLAAQHSGNPTFFRERTEEVTQSILASFGITEA
jgi:outer membrane murein-binding lipoprotein Lpp